MPLTHLNDSHFPQQDIDAVNAHWQEILSILNRQTRNLSPQERQRFGSVQEQNKLVVEKVLDYATHQPHLKSPDVDYNELQADWSDRSFLAALLSKVKEGMRIIDNIRITHDWDAFQAARADYSHARYKLSTDPGAGWEQKYQDLKQFFTTNTGGDEDVFPEEEPGNDAAGTA